LGDRPGRRGRGGWRPRTGGTAPFVWRSICAGKNPARGSASSAVKLPQRGNRALAAENRWCHLFDMSDKQLALDSIERLPENASLEVIAERVEFLAAIRKGLDQIERDETIPHDEVKRQLATWLSK
jgi:hypothetical protein